MAIQKYKSVIGTYEGKCCDSEVYNNNGMLLDDELFDILISSEDFQRAMKNRYYIGFLGHPEDPNDMNFMNACIVMTHMEKRENGEIWGRFDLIDTPVGRVVKAFIDAGVIFGISIRGAGDVDSTGRVDPETFVFRGFDLVTFPAYDDAVPVFTEIAASSDIQKQSKYKKVCAAIKTNLSKIQSCEALEVIQSQFNENSSEYDSIGERIDELNQSSCDNENISLLQQKLDAMTQLYLEQIEANRTLFEENNSLKIQLTSIKSNSSKKIRSLERITSSQIADLEKALTAAENRNKTLVSANSKLKNENQKYVSACDDLKSQLTDSRSELISLRSDNGRLNSSFSSIKASSEKDIRDLEDELENTKSELEQVKNSNLKYKRKIESANQLIAERDDTISGLQSQLSETVTASEKLSQESLNRDDEVRDLEQQVLACQQLIEDYQQSYADMCANAVGISVGNISITGKTTPDELKRKIFGSTSTSGMGANPYVEPQQVETWEDEDYDMDGLVAL